MRLAVIGDTQHYQDAEGRLYALEPVVNQLDRWAQLFDEVVLCAPLGEGRPPAGFAPYQQDNYRIVPLRSAGGNTALAKFGLLGHVVPWALTTRRVARSVDAVHLRCPCNIGLVAALSTWKAVPHRYAMYAGVWHAYDGEPRFYRLQRRLLGSRFFGGPVSVYADPPFERPHLEASYSPSFSIDDWRAAGARAEAKIARIADEGQVGPWRLVTVGRLTTNKNQQTIVRAVRLMVDAGADVLLDVYGDGPRRGDLEQLADELGIADRVHFRGSVDHSRIMEAFATSDLNLLSTRQEGYGKVLLEGMVHATVPVFGESPVAGQVSGGGTRGLVFPPDDHERLAELVVGLISDRPRWAAAARGAREFASTVTLDAFQRMIHDLLERHWAVELPLPLPGEASDLAASTGPAEPRTVT